MLRPMLLTAPALLAPVLLTLAAAPAAAQPGFASPGHGGARGGPVGHRGPVARGTGWRPQPGYARHGRYARGYGYGGYGYGGFGYGGYGGGTSATVVNGAGEAPDWGYRIVTAPGIEERPAGRAVVYVLDTPRRGAKARPYGGPSDPEYGPLVVSLPVPRR